MDIIESEVSVVENVSCISVSEDNIFEESDIDLIVEEFNYMEIFV